jgi:hypothetical protein
MKTEKLLIRRAVGRSAAAIITALVAGYLMAGTAAATTWDVAADITWGGTPGTAGIAPGSPWSYRWTGAGCAGGPVPLPHNYTSNTLLRGWDGQQQPSGPLPFVVRANTPPATLSGVVTVPAAAVLMHPGPLGQCAVVRFTAPPGTNTYNFIGSFYSAYTNNPSKVTACGNGTQPKIVVNKTSPPVIPTLATTGSGNTVPIALSALSLSTGESVDFMVGANGTDFLCDSTILELRVQSTQPPTMYPHGVIAVTPGPVNTCAPYKLCFDVNVPNGPVGNGGATLNLQVVNNANPNSPVVISAQAQTTNVDGQICFQMPALPAGTSYDYIVTTNFTQSLPGIPPLTDQQVLQSPLPGPDNDLVCAGKTASTCCPPLEGKEMTGSLFWHTGVANSTFTMNAVTAQTTPAWNTLATATNAYLNYLKLICPTVANIKTTFTLSAATAMGPTGMATGPVLGTFTVTYLGSGFPSVGTFGATLNDNVNYIIVADTQAYNSQNQVVQCGFDAASCNKLDRFTFNYGFQGLILPGTGSGGTSAAPARGAERALRTNG